MDYLAIDQALFGRSNDSARQNVDDFINGHRVAWSQLRHRGTEGVARYDQSLRQLESMRNESTRDMATGSSLSGEERSALGAAMEKVEVASLGAHLPDPDIGECRAPSPSAEPSRAAPFEPPPEGTPFTPPRPRGPAEPPPEGTPFTPRRPSVAPSPRPSANAYVGPARDENERPAQTRDERLGTRDLNRVSRELEGALGTGDHHSVNQILTSANESELKAMRRKIGDQQLEAQIASIPNDVPGNVSDYRDALRVAAKSERRSLSDAELGRYTDRLVKADGIARIGTDEATVHEMLNFDDASIREIDQRLKARNPISYARGLQSFVDDNFWQGGAEHNLLSRRVQGAR